MDHAEQIKQLRQQVPVGLRHAALLLEKAGGDIMVARQLFIQEMEAVVLSKTTAPPEMVLPLLEQHQYDIPRTLAALEEALYTITERVLRKIKNSPEAAIDKVAIVIETATPLQRSFWLPLDTMTLPNVCQQAFMIIHEWLSYEDDEGFDSALYFHRQLVCTTIRDMLQCPEVATAIGEGDEDAFRRHRETLIQQLYALVANNISRFP
ncbi:hypothetical protein [Chitinophaga varians]|uniref:hypothetical protein n=1 Tax=Chitinophaga varians TaxID=2202339 RepID=UPI00165FCBBE|nr:hypothetical protein [Chitinophaga varians]MBC9909557.1 hypothetical protein [Chitinophaga varians]